MNRALRVLIAGPADALEKARTLIASSGLATDLHVEPTMARVAAAAYEGASWDVCVLAGDAWRELGPGLEAGPPLEMLVPELTLELAILGQRLDARITLFAHGAEPLKLAMLGAAQQAVAARTSEQVRALVNTSVSDVIFHLRVEGDAFRFVDINPAFTRATGLSVAQVVGKLVDDVIPEPSLSLVKSKYREAIGELHTVRWRESTDYPTGRKYGEVSITPVVDLDGRCVSLIGTVHDVTAAGRSQALTAMEQRVLEMVASGESLSDTLTAIARTIEELAPPALASVLLISPDGTRLRHGAGPSLPDAYMRAIDGAPIGPLAGSCGTAAALEKTIVVTDIETDPSWADYRTLAASFDLRACWSAPIIASDGRVLGTFALYYREPRAPGEEELELIARVTHVAGIAIQRHELDDQLRSLSAHIEAAREDERTGIAREIHDQLGQSLTVLKMDLAWIARRATSADGIGEEALLAKVAEIGGTIDEMIHEVRRISAALRPGMLDDIGLAAALSWAGQEFERRTEIASEVTFDLEKETIRGALATALYRIFQEALTNVARHADARHVAARLSDSDGWLTLTVSDDGKGIRSEDIKSPRSLGLLGIRERARRLGGTATIEPDRPSGTRVSVRVPISC